MDKDDIKAFVTGYLFIVIAVFTLLIGLKFVGVMFDMPKDYNRKFSEQNVQICASKGGTPIIEDDYYKECRGAK